MTLSCNRVYLHCTRSEYFFHLKLKYNKKTKTPTSNYYTILLYYCCIVIIIWYLQQWEVASLLHCELWGKTIIVQDGKRAQGVLSRLTEHRLIFFCFCCLLLPLLKVSIKSIQNTVSKFNICNTFRKLFMNCRRLKSKLLWVIMINIAAIMIWTLQYMSLSTAKTMLIIQKCNKSEPV